MTVDCSDHKLRRLLQAVESLVGVQTEVILKRRRDIREHLDVGARAEKLLTLTRNHDHLNSVVYPRSENRAIELLHHLVAVGVRRWIVERNGRNAVASF